MTRAVLFDIDGVLVRGYHARPEDQKRWDEKLLADHGIDPERFSEEFIYDVFVKKVLVGQTSLVTALDHVLPRLGYKGSPVAFAQLWVSRHANLDHAVLDIVAQLKARSDLRLYLATNQDHVRAMWLWETLGLSAYFEDIFYSARARALKPQDRYFDYIKSRIGPQSQPPLFFDDTPKMVVGARSHGWEAVLYREPTDCTNHPWIAARLEKVIV